MAGQLLLQQLHHSQGCTSVEGRSGKATCLRAMLMKLLEITGLGSTRVQSFPPRTARETCVLPLPNTRKSKEAAPRGELHPTPCARHTDFAARWKVLGDYSTAGTARLGPSDKKGPEQKAIQHVPTAVERPEFYAMGQSKCRAVERLRPRQTHHEHPANRLSVHKPQPHGTIFEMPLGGQQRQLDPAATPSQPESPSRLNRNTRKHTHTHRDTHAHAHATDDELLGERHPSPEL